MLKLQKAMESWNDACTDEVCPDSHPGPFIGVGGEYFETTVRIRIL